MRHVTAATAFGGGLDGFDLGIISVVILHINHDLGLSPAMEGLVGAASLLGIFIGAPLFGYLTDKFGRQKMFMVDIISFIVIGVAQAFVTGGVSLAILRFLLGMAIGAEYSIGAPMLSEFAPARERGSKLAFLELCWRIGFLIAVLLGYALLWLGISWKWILATSVIPALVVLGLRIGLPESPRWLLRHGREAEAREIVEKHMGPEFFEAEEFAAESVGEDGYRKLFRKGQLRRTVFVCIFWTCIVTPYFAIFTYAPKVLESLNVKSQATGTILSNTVGAIGALIGLLAIDRIGRRRMLIGPFWVQMVVLLVVGLWTNAPSWVLVLGLAVFALVNSYSDILTAVYPSEIFDTDIRSSGVGLGSAMSRIGAFLGTYLLPIGMGTIGIKWCMVIAAGLCVIGAVTGQFMAPETMNRSLTRTSTGDLMDT
ncbi:MFS transporter [Cutibacterium avidum]|uniref:MFS transporter n=1 Tax=Cutibacterium avidum TaxID=33010 RepID=A0A3E2DFH0_9ACTN|nr:MFS transporter [Cutibacterium avidum]TMT49957.1 MFS transporter [Cutibacterium avidum]